MTKKDPAAEKPTAAAPAAAPAVSLEERPLSYDEMVARKGQLVTHDLLAGLRDGRAMVRANAALGLAALGHTGRDLVPFLRDSHPVAARAAGEAFMHLGLVQRAHLAVIAGALDGARREVVDSVVTMFSLFVGPADADLINVLDTSDGFAVDAVVAACERAGLRGLQLLQAATEDDRARVRLNAVRGVGQIAYIEPVSSVAVMRRAAESDDVSDVRVAALAALEKFMARNRLEVSAQRKQAGHRTLASVPELHARALTPDELRAAAAVAPLDELLHALLDERVAVRLNAVRVLALQGPAAAASATTLAVATRDPDGTVCAEAARALGAFGPAGVAAAPALVRALGDAEAAVVAAAEAALAAQGAAAAPVLVEGLLVSNEQHGARVAALIGRLADGVSLLCEALASTSLDVRVNAALGLGALGRDRAGVALPSLFATKSSGNARLRAALASAIARLDPKPDRTLPPIAIDGFEQRVLTDAELAKGKDALAAAGAAGLTPRLADGRAAVRANAALALGILGDGPGVVDALTVGLRDDDAEVRMAAARAIERLGEAAVATCANDLVRALGRADAPLAARLATVLRAHAHPAITAALVRGLDTTDSHLGLQLAELLCARPAGIERLSEALASASADVQLNAALGLGALGQGGAAALPALIAAKRSEYVRVRAAAAAAIDLIDPKPDRTLAPIAIDGFEARVLTDAELTMGKAALAAAGVAGLVPRLADANANVRANTALALGIVGRDAPGVVDLVAVCLRDDAAKVRMSAARAIERLGEAAVATCADELVRALGGADAPLAAQAATMLRTHAHASVTAALVRGLDTSNARLALQLCELVWARPAGIDLLCDAFSRPAAQANVARGFVMLGKDRLGKARALLERARTSGSPRAREIARATLYAIDGPPPPPPVPAVPGFETEVLEHRAFAKIGALDAKVLLAFVADGRAVVRANAATGVGALGPSAAAHAATIAALLRDDDDRVRIAAARALDQLGDEAVGSAAANLVGALGGNAGVADVCGGVLAAHKGQVEAALLAGLETSDEVHGMRVAELVAALPNARELLFAAFDGEAQNVQINAAFGIAKLGAKRAGPEGRDRLLSGLPGPPTRRRSAMVKALAMLGPEPKTG